MLLISTEAGGCCGRPERCRSVYQTRFPVMLVQCRDVVFQQLLAPESEVVKEILRYGGMEGELEEGMLWNSVTINMSVRSL